MRYLNVEDIKEIGYYWWLPEYLKDCPGDVNNWMIITVIPGKTDKFGVFVGPLFPPLHEGVI